MRLAKNSGCKDFFMDVQGEISPSKESREPWYYSQVWMWCGKEQACLKWRDFFAGMRIQPTLRQ